MLQISAPISSGSSGGPLFVDGDPRVVGVTTSVIIGGQNLNLAVPTRELTRLLRQSPKRPTLPRSPQVERLLELATSGDVDGLQNLLQDGVRFDQAAPTTVAGDDESRYYKWDIDPQLLVNGRNVAAVEVHQRGAISSDLGFDLELAADNGQAAILIPKGATWKYLDDGSDQGSAWRQSDFDDETWKSGPAELGYGDADVVTIVSYGDDENNKHITTYFRHEFHVDDASSVDRLKLALLRDDGAVLYLNGKARGQ